MKRMRAWHAYGLAAAIFLADQLSKYWVIYGLELESRGSVGFLPFWSWTWVENRGVSMGMLQADGDLGRWLLVALTAAIAAAVAYWINSERDWQDLIAMGLILGGALGNIVDRIRLGYVVDFVHLHVSSWSFYVFNVADAAITIGVILMLLRAFFWSEPAGTRAKPE